MLTTMDGYPPIVIVFISYGCIGFLILLIYIFKQKRFLPKESVFFISAAATASALILSLLKPVLAAGAAAVFFLAGITALCLHIRKNDSGVQNEPDTHSKNRPEAESASSVFPIITGIMRQTFSVLTAKTDISAFIDYINSTLIRISHAEGGMILFLNDFGDTLEVRSQEGAVPLYGNIAQEKQTDRYGRFNLHNTSLGQAAVNGRPIWLKNTGKQTNRDPSAGNLCLEEHSCFILPLVFEDTMMGLSVLSKTAETVFTEHDFITAQHFASFAAAAFKSLYMHRELMETAARQKETDIAADFRRWLPPVKKKDIPSLSVGIYSKTVPGIHGDYHDILQCRKSIISFLIADIPCKGVKSLSVMVILRTLLKLVLNTAQNTGKIMEWINRGLIGDENLDRYVSMAIINYNEPARTADLSVCGTVSAVIYRTETNTISEIALKNDPIGVTPNTTYRSMQIELCSGDMIVLYTDGLSGALSADRKCSYTQDRLKTLLYNNRHRTGTEITDTIRNDMQNFCADTNIHDDQTVLVLKSL